MMLTVQLHDVVTAMLVRKQHLDFLNSLKQNVMVVSCSFVLASGSYCTLKPRVLVPPTWCLGLLHADA